MKTAQVPAEDLREAGAETEKFELFMDLGTIKMPENYCLDSFRQQNSKYFVYYEETIVDGKFRPSHVPRPGEELRFRVFGQTSSEKTTYYERVAFCRRQADNVFIGPVGIALLFEERRECLAKGLWYASLDEPERLLKYEVPNLVTLEKGGFGFHLAPFSWDRNDKDLFLSISTGR